MGKWNARVFYLMYVFLLVEKGKKVCFPFPFWLVRMTLNHCGTTERKMHPTQIIESIDYKSVALSPFTCCWVFYILLEEIFPMHLLLFASHLLKMPFIIIEKRIMSQNLKKKMKIYRKITLKRKKKISKKTKKVKKKPNIKISKHGNTNHHKISRQIL